MKNMQGIKKRFCLDLVIKCVFNNHMSATLDGLKVSWVYSVRLGQSAAWDTTALHLYLH